jgi:hypothetical protein
MLPVQILMETVVVAFAILEQQRRRLYLPGVMASEDEFGMRNSCTTPGNG